MSPSSTKAVTTKARTKATETTDDVGVKSKTTISLPAGKAVETLQELAEERSASYAEVVRQALTLDKYIADARKKGCRILVEDPNELITEIKIF